MRNSDTRYEIKCYFCTQLIEWRDDVQPKRLHTLQNETENKLLVVQLETKRQKIK